MVSVLDIKAGQLLTTVKPEGLFALSVAADILSVSKRIYHEDKFFSKKIPIGEIFLCLEVKGYDEQFCYSLKILWKEQIYYIFCDYNEVRVVE